MSIKQDRIATRTSEDLRRRLNVKAIDESIEKSNESMSTVEQLNTKVAGISNSLDNTRNTYVSTQTQTFTELQKTRARNNIGAGNSSFSGSYNDLEDKPTSLGDINLSEGAKLYSIEYGAQKNVVDSYMSDSSTNPVQNKVVKAYIDDNMGTATTYFASSYAESGVSILRSSLEVKNNRVCFNFVGTKSMNANTTTTLFTFPSDLRPIETRDFVVFGQSSNTDGYIGYGYITPDGLLQVRFNQAISSYIRFTAVYDIY